MIEKDRPITIINGKMYRNVKQIEKTYPSGVFQFLIFEFSDGTYKSVELGMMDEIALYTTDSGREVFCVTGKESDKKPYTTFP